MILNVDWGLFIGIGFNILSIVMREQFFSSHLIRNLVKSKNDMYIEDGGYILVADDDSSKEVN